MNTTPNTQPGPQGQHQYPNGAHYNTGSGPQPAYQYPPLRPQVRRTWWERDGVIGKIFAGAGVFVTLIGVVMLLVIAARAGLLRPEIRVAGGALLSGLLLAGSIRLESSLGGRIGAIALAATGTAGLFLCVVAATNFYEWIPGAAGLVIAAAIAAGTVAIAMRWNSQALAVMMTAGVGVLAPVLTEGLTVPLIAFLVLLQAAGCVPEFSKDWPAIAAARTLPVALAATVAAELESYRASTHVAAYLVATIALASALMASRRTNEWITACVYAVASVPMIVAVTSLTGPVAAIAGAAIAVMTLGAVVAARPVGTGTSAAAALVVGAALMASAVTVTRGPWLSVILLGIGVVLAASTYQVKNHYAAALSIVFTAAGYLAVAVTGVGTSVEDEPGVAFTAGLLMTISALLIALVGVRRYGADMEGATALGTIALLASTGLVHCGLFALVLGDGGRPVAQFAITVTWMLIASALLWLSLRVEGSATATVSMGLSVSVLALGKLFLHDLSSLDGIVRAGAFIVVGLTLLAAGAGYAQAFAKRAAARRVEVERSAPQQPRPMVTW